MLPFPPTGTTQLKRVLGPEAMGVGTAAASGCHPPRPQAGGIHVSLRCVQLFPGLYLGSSELEHQR